MTLAGQTILVTGGARRVGKILALAAARAGANVIIHHAHSPEGAAETLAEIEAMGRNAWTLQADLEDLSQCERLVEQAFYLSAPFALVNNAAVFEPLDWQSTTISGWQRHFNLDLAAPFFLSQAFARLLPAANHGRIINILDWRALHPGRDHLPYTIAKAGLAALTRSLALSLAPHISVNGLAFGALLPPADKGTTDNILKSVPAKRWARPEEAAHALVFLLEGPEYVTGDIIQLDGGRHLV